MLQNIGVATSELDGHKLSEAQIVERIKEMENHCEGMSTKAKDLSAKIKAEKGLERAVELIREVMSEEWKAWYKLQFCDSKKCEQMSLFMMKKQPPAIQREVVKTYAKI